MTARGLSRSIAIFGICALTWSLNGCAGKCKPPCETVGGTCNPPPCTRRGAPCRQECDGPDAYQCIQEVAGGPLKCDSPGPCTPADECTPNPCFQTTECSYSARIEKPGVYECTELLCCIRTNPMPPDSPCPGGKCDGTGVCIPSA